MNYISNLKNKILRFIYKLLIFEIIVINNNEELRAEMREFSNLTIHTSHGDLIFTFYQDRRKKKRRFLIYKAFIVSIKAPELSNDHLKNLEKYLILVLKIMPRNIDYKILAEVLFDKCLTKYIEIAESNMGKVN